MTARFSLAGRRVTILGWARSGRAAAALARELGADVFVSEQKPLDRFPEEAQAEARRYTGEFGGHSDRARESDLVILSPGIPLKTPALAGFRGKVWSELELAWRALRGRVVAVTGTNGKTTTTTLIGELLQEGYPAGVVRTAGNIGRAVSGLALETRPGDVTVIEVSSFQCETIEAFRPDIAVYLNLRSDHLDWYPDFAAYRAAKERIFLNMAPADVAILNLDDPETQALAARLQGPRLVTVAAAGAADWTLTPAYTPEMLAAVKSPENLLSALAAASLLGVPRDRALATLGKFRGLPHRIERLGERDGVSYWNDSKATNVSAVETALKFVPAPIVLIMGGKDKGEDYRELLPLVREKCAKVIAYGEAAPRIASLLPAEVVPVFGEAFAAAARAARPGAAVLLSPACSSYDQFKDYVARGEAFRALFAGRP